MFDFWTGAEDLPVYGYVIRAAIVYIYVFVLIKVLGQRTIGNIHPLDFLFGVIIGDVLGEPLADGDTELAGPFAAAALIGGTHLFLSYLALKTPRFRRIIEDEPLVLIENGQILHKELRKAKITMESLLMDLRLNSAVDLNEVDYAVLESSGQISVIKKSQYDSLSPNDIGQYPQSKGYPTVLIQDGHVIDTNLNKVRDRTWLYEQLQRHGLNDPSECFFLTLDNSGSVYLCPYTNENEKQNA
ncbi:YetF domain-containing protein [Texcoconibacillus texcoconensis]|uniref:Uncharacterized membrane protein YcaP (DUF421 family) n=1 Tax=Texcoconibacillus texcoconensis TaxID=1095777 RepID=A0A840QSX6_9BACI|nr:uncharacterized membrane protein YcaP (DUF421 family) [Texcoconibacillus texcoconensis]